MAGFGSVWNRGVGRTGALLVRPCGPMPVGYWLLIAGFAGLLYGYNLGGAKALTEHEIVVAGIAKQMVRDGTWGALWIGDLLWLEKPPLPHWLAALMLAVLGDIGEAAVRLPSALEGVGVALIVAGLAAGWYGAEIGLLTGLIQSSTWYMMNHARLAENDMVLCLLVVAAIAAFVRLQAAETADRRALSRRRLLFWLLVGATNLSKGPFFGAAMVLVPCLGWLVWRRDTSGFLRLMSLPAILSALLIAAAWPAAMVVQGHGDALFEWWWTEIAGRVDGTYFDRAQPSWHYLTTIPVQLLPWTPLLLFCAASSLARAVRRPDSADRFLWCWAVLPIAVLSLPPHKHHHYIIHALPAASPVMALGVARIGQWLGRLSGRRRAIGGAGFGALGGALLIVGSVGTVALPEVRLDAWLITGLVAAGVIAIGVCVLGGRIAVAATVLMATVLLAWLTTRVPWIQRRDESAADRTFLLRVADRVPADATLFASGGQAVARHTFYIRRPVDGVWLAKDIAGRLTSDAAFYAVIWAREAGALSDMGAVERIDQSAHARYERSPLDRYTLYRIEPPAD